MTLDEKLSAGLAEDDARRRSLLEFAGLDQVKERVREVRSGAVIDQVRQDLVFAVRMLRKNVGFTGIAVTTIALGIGASTAIFSVVDTVVFRPLPYTEPDRLVKICGTGPDDRACADDFSMAELERLRAGSDIFEQIAADDGMATSVIRPDGTRERLGIGLVSSNWLSTLGVRPILGRDFAVEEGRPGRDHVVLLTHDYWRHRFNADRQVIGMTLTFGGVPHTIIGVLPPNVLRLYADVLKPLVTAEYSDRSLDVTGRLKPGVTLAQAGAAVETIGHHLEQEYAGTNRRRVLSIQSLGKYYAPVQRRAGQGLVLMLGAVGLVLLIACANVASLLLARAGTRRRESIIRATRGASRARLVRQMLIESLLLFAAGGALGVVVAARPPSHAHRSDGSAPVRVKGAIQRSTLNAQASERSRIE